MANSLGKLRAIAVTSLQETLRRRVLYLIVVLAIILILGIVSASTVLRMTIQAGETATAESMASGFVGNILQTWKLAGICLAFFLGAVGFSSEVASKTLVNVLSRPVGRATYLAGRWAGILLFLCAFHLAGIALALIIAGVFDVRFAPTLWVGFAAMFVDVFFFSGVSLGLSVLFPPVLAGTGAVLLTVLPSLVENATRNPRWFLRLPAIAGYYLGPAGMPTDPIADSLSKQFLNPEYAIYAKVLVENALYAVALFVLACAVFSKREIRFR